MVGRAIILRKEGSIAWITLNRPAEGNGPDLELAAALREACAEVAQDDEVRVVLVTGAGRQFCSPASPAPLRPGTVQDGADLLSTHQLMALLRVAAPVAALEKPTIAVINGAAIGQGLELALACDLRITSQEARFAMPHLQEGLVPWDGGTQRLPRVVGRARALELLLTGREVDAPEALALGLVHQVVSPDQLGSRAQELADRLARHAPIALKYAKEAVSQGMELSLAAGLRLEADLSILLQSTYERAEGIRSFRERRRALSRGQ